MNAQFAGREHELDELDRWLERSNSGGPKLALLTAPAGRGKSALVTRWIDALRHRGDLALIFVPISGRFHTNRADIVLPALAVELSNVLGEPIETPAIGALEAYRDIIANRLSMFGQKGMTCLLVIDGVDETKLGGWDLGEALLPADPPNGLRVLVTARQLVGDKGADGWRRRLGWASARTPITEIKLGKLSLPEVSSLLHRAFKESLYDRHVVAALSEEVFRLSERGDPLVVELYVNDLLREASTGSRTILAIAEQLTARRSGLGAYFEDWVEEQKRLVAGSTITGSINFQVYEATLLLLATALGPIRHRDLIELLRRILPNDHIPGRSILLAPLERFIIGDDSDGFTLGHPLFGAFLKEKQYIATPLLEKCDEAFLAWGRDVTAALEAGDRMPQETPEYLLDFYPQHLGCAEGVPPRVLSSVLSNVWVTAYRAFQKDAALAVAVETILEALLSQLTPHSIPDVDVTGAAIRASMFLASLRQAASETSSDLLFRAVECGLIDQRAVVARKALIDSSRRLQLLLRLAGSEIEVLDRLALWQEARAIALSEKSPEVFSLQTRVIEAASDLLVRLPICQQAAIRAEALVVVRARLALPVRWYNPARYSASIDELLSNTEDISLLIQYARVFFESVAPIHSLPIVFREFSRLKRDLLCAVFKALQVESGHGPLARTLYDLLTCQEDRIAEYIESCLSSSEKGASRLRLAAILLGFVIEQNTAAKQIVIRCLLEEADARCLLTFISADVFGDGELSLRQAAFDSVWRESATIAEPYNRTRIRSYLYRVSSTMGRDEWFNLVKEDVQANPRMLNNWPISSLAQQFSSSQCRALLELVPRYEWDERHLSRLIEKAGISVADTYDKAENSEIRPFSRSGERQDDDFRSRYSEQQIVTQAEYAEALKWARSALSRRERARRVEFLITKVSKELEREAIQEAMRESGEILDGDVAIQARVEVAQWLSAKELRVRLEEALNAVKKLDPERAVMVATNLSYRVPDELRKQWANAAIEALGKITVDGKRARWKGTVFARFSRHAPLAMGFYALQELTDLDDREQGWLYRDLIETRGVVGAIAAMTAIYRYRDLPPELRMRVGARLQSVYPYLLFWLPWICRADVGAMLVQRRPLREVLDLASDCRGRNRQRLVEHFIDRLESGEQPDDYDYPSVYGSLRWLYERCGKGSKDAIRGAVAGLAESNTRTHYQLCLLPALSRVEQGDLAAHLFNGIAPSSNKPLVSGYQAEHQFSQLTILFLYAPELHVQALRSLIRVGAHARRTAWLNVLREIVRAWPVSNRCKLGDRILNAIDDATFLWP